MRNVSVALFVVAVLVAACGDDTISSGPTSTEPEVPFLAPGDHDIALNHDGRTRDYRVHVPASAPRVVPAVVVMLHGGGGSMTQVQQQIELDATAAEAGFVVVYPDGTGVTRLHAWNAGHCCGRAADDEVDDVGFLDAVVADLSTRIDVSRDRLVVAGHSNGAMMAQRWAAESSGSVAGVFGVGGVADPAMVPGQPTPFVHVHSVDDPRAPYDGGEGETFIQGDTISSFSVDDLMSAWLAANGCGADVAQTDARSLGDERLLVLEGRDCAAPTRHLRLEGSGHAWPGATGVNERLVGPPSALVSANTELATFVAEIT